ncbi:hypothetical protein MHK_002777 [Candidatus Magnetomorum sp. HK-1]|nr:hypothetical protein MHK_002777 [Candidatus Magnetomorum sp. HK-1]
MNENKKWQCHVFPFDPVSNEGMVEISPEIIKNKNKNELMRQRFDKIVPCLYKPGQYHLKSSFSFKK